MELHRTNHDHQGHRGRRARRTGSTFALTAAIVVIMALAAPAASAHGVDRPRIVMAAAALSDLAPTVANATDGASAGAIAISRNGRSTFVLAVWGLDRDSAETVHGAHLHVGPCVAGNGAAAGPHYNSDPSAPVSSSNEVWLDFEPNAEGRAIAIARVPFVVQPGGAGSIVIHALPTASNGAAGARLACLPFEL